MWAELLTQLFTVRAIKQFYACALPLGALPCLKPRAALVPWRPEGWRPRRTGVREGGVGAGGRVKSLGEKRKRGSMRREAGTDEQGEKEDAEELESQ